MLTRKQSDAPLFSELEDLGANQGKSYDHVVAIIHSKLYLGELGQGNFPLNAREGP